MSPSQIRTILAWILLVLVAVMFGASALAKLSGRMTEMFEVWGYPAWFATFIGVVELLGAIGLLIPKTTRWAVYGLTAVMVGAAYTHVAAGEGSQVLRPIVFAGVMWTALFVRGRAARG